MNINKTTVITICSIIGGAVFGALIYFAIDNDIFSEIFSSRKDEVVLINNGQKTIIKKEKSSKTKNNSKLNPFNSKVNITKNKASIVKYQPFNNGLFSMEIPKGWIVGVARTDYVHYTFMVYDPKNPDYKLFFNMKTEGYAKTQQMKNIFTKYYKNSQTAKLPVINPQTTEAFYKVYTQTFSSEQKIIPFRVPVIKNFKAIQTLGKNQTGGAIIRGTYQNESGKQVEGIFTTTIKEFAVPPVVLLMVYNTIYFTAPEGELIDWQPVLSHCLSTIKFSKSFVNGYYQQQNQIVKNASAIASICNQTSDIITSGWKERQKTYDILSQKRSDATMGYDRVRNTETGEIYKADLNFMDYDWHGKYEKISDDMYNLPTAGYIEKR